MSLINQVILLQEVDNKLFEIEKLLGDLPAKVEELTQNEDNVKLSLQKKENNLKETSVAISSNETLVRVEFSKKTFNTTYPDRYLVSVCLSRFAK